MNGIKKIERMVFVTDWPNSRWWICVLIHLKIEFYPCRIFCDEGQLIEKIRKAHQQFQAPFILYKTAFLEPRPP